MSTTDRPAGLAGLIPWLLVGAALLWIYGPIAGPMVVVWSSDPNYSHGYLVPLVTIWLLWRDKAALAQCASGPDWKGLAMVGAGLFVLVAGSLAHEYFLQRASLVPVLWGLAWLLWGWRLAKRSAFAIWYLLLMVPWPYIVYDSLAFPLRLAAASMAGWCVRLVGIPVLVEGNVIHLPHAVLNVIDACSGIRSMVSLLAAALFLAYVMLPRIWPRFVVALAAPLVAVLTNSLRITIAAVLAEKIGPQTLEGVMHDAVGWIVFMVGFGLLALLAWLLAKFTGPKQTEGVRP